MLQITGDVDNRDDMIEELQQENERLRQALAVANGALTATKHLRRQLSPLYRALQEIFGELDTIGDDNRPEGAASTGKAQAYEQWKAKLGVPCGKIIDALLAHGSLDNKALVLATGYHRTTLPRPIAKLRQAGLLLTRDGKYVLRDL